MREMSFQQSGVLSWERPPLVINHFVFPRMDGQHLQCQTAHCEVPCAQTTLGTVIFRARVALDMTFWQKFVQKWLLKVTLYIFSSPSYMSQFSPRKLTFVSLASTAPSVGQVWEHPWEGPLQESRAHKFHTKNPYAWDKNGLHLCLCPLFPSHW